MRSALLILSALLISPLSGADELNIVHPYARAMAPGATTSAIFAKLENTTEQAVHIIRATTPAAGHVELHTVIKNGDMMKMRQIEQLDIPPSGTLELKPGGYHIMLFDLSAPLQEGQTISVEVEFSTGDKQRFDVPVKKVMSGMKSHHH